MADRKCFKCDQEWDLLEKPKCQCWKEVPMGTKLICPPRDRRIDLQLCCVCEMYHDCEAREAAQVKKLLDEENGKEVRCKEHPRYTGKLQPRVDCKKCWDIFYEKRRVA